MASTSANEVVLPGQGLGELDLQVASGLADANPVVLGKAIEQLHPRLQHAIPAIPFGVVETAVPTSCPLPEEHRGSILPLEVGSNGLFKCPAEQHCGPGVFLFPAIQVAMLVAAWTG